MLKKLVYRFTNTDYIVNKEDWRPTKKGISIRTDLIPELRKGLDKAQKAWQKQIKNSN